jgi:hypothetical protein
MFNSFRKIGVSLLGLFLLSSTSWAAPAAVEGKVLDAKGQPLAGAEIRVENPKGGAAVRVLKTDAKGMYMAGGLVAGNVYRINLVINGQVKASINNVKTKIGDPIALNFDLRKAPGSTAAAKPHKHKVFVPSETGSNLGGRWVEVDDENPQVAPGAENVRKAGNDAVRSMQMGSR